jgi:UDP-N-acetylglucosamine:LPS N-acetylglucosamine transferase
MFVGSERIKELAKVRGKVPEEKLVLSGLPIRHEFSVQSEALGDRMSEAGKAYQQKTRQQLGLPCTDRKTVLLMGGGEGVGSLSNITDALYSELVSQGIDALLIVVCGRNEKLKNSLATRDWNDVIKRWKNKDRFYSENTLMSFSETCVPSIRTSAGCLETGRVTGSIRKMLAKGTKSMGNAMTVPLPTSEEDEAVADEEEKKAEMNDAAAQYSSCILEDSINSSQSFVHSLAEERSADVKVVGLGFVSNIAEYMVAADILVSKAGPGTISEAAALSLPIMLTSYLPGQEEGNVDYVVEAGFGAYVHDSDPIGIAEEICMWLTDDEKRAHLSRAAKRMGAPYAARDIARAIGESTLKWMELNKSKKSAPSKK